MQGMIFGGMGVWAVLHLLLMAFTSGFGVATNTCTVGDAVVESWACGSPFEIAVRAAVQDTNFFSKAASVGGSVFVVLWNFVSFNYDLLKFDGMLGAIALTIRMLAALASVTLAAATIFRMFGRG